MVVENLGTGIYCKCGCGEEIEPGNTYVNHHQLKDPEWREKIFTDEVQERRLEGLRQARLNPEYGEKISKALTGREITWGDKISESRLGFSLSMEACGHMSEAQLGIQKTPEHCKNISRGLLKLHKENPSIGEECSRRQTGVPMSKEACENNSRAQIQYNKEHPGVQKERWKDPEYCSKMAKSLNKRPNGPESEFLYYLNEDFPGLFEYWGDGRKGSIGGKLPDFVCQSQKLIIELFGIYWHKYDDDESRIDYFKDNGYKCLVVWLYGSLDVALDYHNVKAWIEDNVVMTRVGE